MHTLPVLYYVYFICFCLYRICNTRSEFARNIRLKLGGRCKILRLTLSSFVSYSAHIANSSHVPYYIRTPTLKYI